MKLKVRRLCQHIHNGDYTNDFQAGSIENAVGQVLVLSDGPHVQKSGTVKSNERPNPNTIERSLFVPRRGRLGHPESTQGMTILKLDLPTGD